MLENELPVVHKPVKLKANKSHPTWKKLERVISLLETLKLDFEWKSGKIQIIDQELGVSFDYVGADDAKPITDMPPLWLYKLIRDKKPVSGCECRYCDPKIAKEAAL